MYQLIIYRVILTPWSEFDPICALKWLYWGQTVTTKSSDSIWVKNNCCQSQKKKTFWPKAVNDYVKGLHLENNLKMMIKGAPFQSLESELKSW